MLNDVVYVDSVGPGGREMVQVTETVPQEEPVAEEPKKRTRKKKVSE